MQHVKFTLPTILHFYAPSVMRIHKQIKVYVVRACSARAAADCSTYRELLYLHFSFQAAGAYNAISRGLGRPGSSHWYCMVVSRILGGSLLLL